MGSYFLISQRQRKLSKIKREIYSKLKEKEKRTLEKTTNETDNLPDKGFKTLIIRMITELGKRIDEHRILTGN